MKTFRHPLLLLMDGSSLLYRAFHALPPLINTQGQPTGAVFGVINMIRRLLQDYSPDYVGVVFDSKEKNFRHDLYAEYKAHRPVMPEDLQTQIQPLHQIIRALGLPLLVIDGVEADDVIGTLATQAAAHSIDTLISTSDKDLTQLVNEHVFLINTMTHVLLDSKGVQEKFGVPPELMVDYLTLTGDASDNIPGVPNVGPKTAVKWLREYGSLDQIIHHAPDIPGVMGDHLRKTLPDLPLMRNLVTVRCDVKLAISVTELTRQSQDREQLMQLFEKLEFKAWLSELRASTGHSSQAHATQAEKKYHTILSQVDFENLLNRLRQSSVLALDTETTSLSYRDAKIVGISLAVNRHEAFYIPVGHRYAGAPVQLEKAYVLEQLKPILENTSIKKVGQNIKYDQAVLANEAIVLRGVAFDTMLESYVLDSTLTRHDLTSLASRYLGIKKLSYEDVAGKGTKQIPFSEVAVDVATDYAASDADVTLQLHHYFWPQLESQKKLHFIFSTIEMPLVEVLGTMERNGVLVNSEKLHQLSQEFEKRMQVLEQQAFQLAEAEFNLDSPKQLQEILYHCLKLPVLKKTPTGQPSTAEPILQELALDYPLPSVILEYRSLSKLKSTYTDQLPQQINPKTGRIHTSYQQAVATTGRLSSTDPNLQNIPIRSEEGKRIRQAFIAPPGYRMVAADYSQIELRIMAHFSKDSGLLDAFSQGKDVHRSTASQLFAVRYHDVTDDQRRKAKTINFGLIYGMSAFGLAKQLGVDRQTAQTYMDAYFAQFPQLLTYMENMRLLARQQGYVETWLGRKLFIPDIHSKNIHQQKAAERAAINAPIQGTAADIIKLAMIHVHQWIEDSRADCRLIMQVHDELVFEVAEKEVSNVTPVIDRLMSSVIQLAVPLVVDIGVGDNWGEAR